jgi:hypothetical protein
MHKLKHILISVLIKHTLFLFLSLSVSLSLSLFLSLSLSLSHIRNNNHAMHDYTPFFPALKREDSFFLFFFVFLSSLSAVLLIHPLVFTHVHSKRVAEKNGLLHWISEEI